MTIHDLASEAASYWNFTPVALLRNRENAVFEVAGPTGRAALRLHRMGYQDDAAIRSELWWCAALAERGVPVPAALSAQNGERLITLSTGRKASCIAWVDGTALGEAGVPFHQPLEELIDLHRVLGGVIAQLHQTTNSLTLPANFTRPRWDIQGLVGEAPFWGRFWDHPCATDQQRITLNRARAYLRDKLTDHTAKGARLAPIHADLLRENILVNDRSISIIDFDDSGIGFPLYDLGTAMVQNLYEPAYPQIRDALMAGYGTDDTEMVEVFILARTCASVGWTMPRLPLTDPVHITHLARACMWADRLFARWP
jgi:Ser/Thr protein kinase RdoA (MazF antagonist)